MEKWLSCDWGTSSFRIRCIRADTLEVMGEQTSDMGSLHCFEQWKKSGKEESSRIGFYCDIINEHLARLEATLHQRLTGLPVIVSGMASSTIGMMELEYKSVPFHVSGSDLKTALISRSENFPHDILMISGARTGEDVMRGEETKMAGCNTSDENGLQMFILPGTHSKHIYVNEKQVTGFETFMTGEFFELLSQKSILYAAVEKNDAFDLPANKKSFETGVKRAADTNILHASFLTRTNQLFEKFSKQENFFYLSGLLIGCELKEIAANLPCPVTLVSNETFTPFYQHALSVLYDQQQLPHLTIEHADLALIRGQHRILLQTAFFHPA